MKWRKPKPVEDSAFSVSTQQGLDGWWVWELFEDGRPVMDTRGVQTIGYACMHKREATNQAKKAKEKIIKTRNFEPEIHTEPI